MKTYAFTGKILNITRRNNSYYGNPAWALVFEYDGEIIETKTASNAACGYIVPNYKAGDYMTVRGHYTKKNNFIIDAINAEYDNTINK